MPQTLGFTHSCRVFSSQDPAGYREERCEKILRKLLHDTCSHDAIAKLCQDPSHLSPLRDKIIHLEEE